MESVAPVTSWGFIKENYHPQDRIAIVIRHCAEDCTLQRLLSAQDAASPRIQCFLRYENAHGSDIYVSMNTLKPGSRGRTEADIADIPHLYLNLDEDGDARVQQIVNSSALPRSSYALDTSPSMRQVIWRVKGFTLEQAEAALRRVAAAFGGDPAATGAARLLRLPGLRSRKFKEHVRVNGCRLGEAVYRRVDFAGLPGSPAPERRTMRQASSNGLRSNGRPLSQSERDWAWARYQLRSGVAPAALQRALAQRRTDKQNPTAAPRELSRERVQLHLVDDGSIRMFPEKRDDSGNVRRAHVWLLGGNGLHHAQVVRGILTPPGMIRIIIPASRLGENERARTQNKHPAHAR